MKNVFAVFAVLMLCAVTSAQKKANEKLDASTEVVVDIGRVKETIPTSLMNKAEGLIIIPNLLNAGLVVGGKRGKGLALVKKENGSWSAPAFITLTGGSLGFQAGVQKVDLILVFMKKGSLLELGKSDFTLGGDISIAAGPVGRNSSAKTNQDLTAEVYSYSRSRGLFAGISIDGSLIKLNNKINRDLYGEKMKTTEDLIDRRIPKNSSLSSLYSALENF